jgi:hypothetical protein
MNVSERMTLFSDGANGVWQQGGVDKVTMTTDESWRKGGEKNLLCLLTALQFEVLQWEVLL